MNQTQLGELGGVLKQAQIKYEKGERFPDAAYLAAIAAVGADVRYIITGERDGPPPEALSADERVLLDRYRSSPPSLKDAALRVLLGGEPTPVKRAKTIIHGSVGNKMRNNTGELTINMGDKKK